MNENFQETGSAKDDPELNSVTNGEESKPNLKSVMRLFIAVFLLLLFFGSFLQGWHFEYGMMITQVAIILLPALWFWRRHRVNQVAFARLHTLQPGFIPVIIVLSASMWILNMVVASGMVLGLMEFGYEPVMVIEPPRTVQDYLMYIVVLSVFAGICEEVLFRGTIMPALEQYGAVPAIVFSSLLFALFHGSFLNLISTFTLGAVMAVIVIKTGSLWGGILYHMLNNFYAATYLYLAGQGEAAAEMETFSFLIYLPVLILGLAGTYFSLRLLQKRSKHEPLLPNRERWLPRGWFNIPLVAGIFIFLFLALFELAIGFNWFNLGNL
jgi:uncharacterized protein